VVVVAQTDTPQQDPSKLTLPNHMGFNAHQAPTIERLNAGKPWFDCAMASTLAAFQSVPMAVVLISMLALGVLVGVFLPQNNLMEVHQIKAQYGPWYRIMAAMGAFNVYHCHWFITIKVLFFFNLLLGSFRWLKPAFIAATDTKTLPYKRLQGLSDALQWPSCPLQAHDSVDTIKAALERLHFRVWTDPNHPNQLYARKASWTRLGPHMAHIGILSLLLATTYGSFTGFMAQKLVSPGESFTLAQVDSFKPHLPLSVWMGEIPNWRIHVDDFKMEVYPDDPAVTKQFTSQLRLEDLNNPKHVIQQAISVNHPLNVGAMTIYQASFMPTGKLFFEFNGQPQTLQVNSQFQNRSIALAPLNAVRPNGQQEPLSLVAFPFFMQQDPGVSKNYVVLFLRDDNGFIGQGTGKMPENLRLEQGQSGQLHGIRFTYKGPQIATGLQIKQAPETTWVYLSFAVIMLGTLMCIPGQRRIWVAVDPTDTGSTVALLPWTNRSKIRFAQELLKLKRQLESQLKPPLSEPPAT
jgi:cytochrome c biogenesis protein